MFSFVSTTKHSMFKYNVKRRKWNENKSSFHCQPSRTHFSLHIKAYIITHKGICTYYTFIGQISTNKINNSLLLFQILYRCKVITFGFLNKNKMTQNISKAKRHLTNTLELEILHSRTLDPRVKIIKKLCCCRLYQNWCESW